MGTVRLCTRIMHIRDSHRCRIAPQHGFRSPLRPGSAPLQL